VKTLPEVLHDAMLLLGDDRENVVIARGQQHEPLDARSEAFQIRLSVATSIVGARRMGDEPFSLTRYSCEARSWLGEQWAHWRVHRGWLGGASFDLDDVLATDWRIAS